MKDIPLPTKRRLVLLERLLSGYKEKNITSQKIQELTGWTSAVVRRDISALKLNCGATNGYKVEELKSHLEKMFGEKKKLAVLHCWSWKNGAGTAGHFGAL